MKYGRLVRANASTYSLFVAGAATGAAVAAVAAGAAMGGTAVAAGAAGALVAAGAAGAAVGAGAAGAEHALSVARIVRTQRTTSKRRCMGKLLLGLI
jgi:hypothetical protein